MIGGVGDDLIDTGNGFDILFGDNGLVAFNAAGVATTVESHDDVALSAGNDNITASDGVKYVVGGYGNDVIKLGDGDNIIFGDSGRILIDAAGTVRSVVSINVSVGGDDQVVTGDGRNVVIGGIGNDTLSAGDGGNVMLGDSGQVTRDATGAYVEVVTTDPNLGGNDQIMGGSGADILIGGNGRDELFGYNGFNVVIGDSGQVFYLNGTVLQAQTIDLYAGADDILHGGDNLSLLFGGAGSDLFYGSFDTDVMIGDYGSATFAGDKITSVARFGPATNSPDLIARSQDVLFVRSAHIDRRPVANGDNADGLARMDALIASIALPQNPVGIAFSLRPTESFHHIELEFDQAAAAPVQPGEPAQSAQGAAGVNVPASDAEPAGPPLSPAAGGAGRIAPVPTAGVPEAADEPVFLGNLDAFNVAMVGLTGAGLLTERTRSSGAAMQFDPRTGQWLVAGKAAPSGRRSGLGLDFSAAVPIGVQSVATTTSRLVAAAMHAPSAVIEVMQGLKNDAAAIRAKTVNWKQAIQDETETIV